MKVFSFKTSKVCTPFSKVKRCGSCFLLIVMKPQNITTSFYFISSFILHTH